MVIEKWVVAPGESRIIDLEGVRRLKVALLGGKVTVIAHDEPGVRIEISDVVGRDLTIESDGDGLVIDHPGFRWENWTEAFRNFRGSARAQVSLLAPRDVVLRLGVVSADALVSGFATDARLNTVSGDLTVDAHRGNLELNGVSGELAVAGHQGGVRAHTVSGDVTVSGEITSFRASGVSGNMMIDTAIVPDRVDTSSVSGNLTVRIGAASAARFRVHTVSGTVLLGDETISSPRGQGFERVHGRLAGSWLDFSANSVSGNVAVLQPAWSTQ